METSISRPMPTANWWHQSFSSVSFPTLRKMAALTTFRFSAWAKNEAWIRQLARNGERQIPNQSDPTYQAFLKKEIAYWQKPAHGDTGQIYGNEEHPARNPKLRAYWNTLMSGSPTVSRVDMLRRLGPVDKALTLGHFHGLEEVMASGVAKHWTFNSITGRFTDGAPTQGVAITSEDLNFACFKENEYDLIVSMAILHHIVNVDQLLEQINRALTPNGRFVVLDYIGEERFQWREDKRQFINGLLRRIPPKYLRFPFAGIDAVHLGRLSPFEAVTSTRLPAAFERHLRPLEVRTGHAVLFPTAQYLRARYLSEDNPIVDQLIEADREATQLGLQPAAIAGVYAKRTDSEPVRSPA